MWPTPDTRRSITDDSSRGSACRFSQTNGSRAIRGWNRAIGHVERPRHVGQAAPVVAELLRPDVDRGDVEGEREQVAVAIDDLPAMRDERDLLVMLARRLARELRPAQDGEIDRAAEQQQEAEREERGDDDHARAAAARQPHRRSTTCPFCGSARPIFARAASASAAASCNVASSARSWRRSWSSRSSILRAADSW